MPRLLLLLSLLVFQSASGQTTYSLRAFTGVGFVQNAEVIFFPSPTTYIRVIPQENADLNPGVALVWSRLEHIKNELELTELRLSRENPYAIRGDVKGLEEADFPQREFRFRLRQGIQAQRQNLGTRRVWFSFGGGYSIFYRSLSVAPRYDFLKKISRRTGGISLDLLPQWHWRLLPHWQLDLSFLVVLADFAYQSERDYNTNIPEALQRDHHFIVGFGPREGWLRLGLTYRLTPPTEEAGLH